MITCKNHDQWHEWKEAFAEWVKYGLSPVPREVSRRLRKAELALICPCCGEVPNYTPLPSCGCANTRDCVHCERCYQHCNCVTKEARLNQLRAEREQARHALDQAENLAFRLGVLEEDFGGEDELIQLIREHEIYAKVLSRTLRRLYRYWEVGDEAERLAKIVNAQTKKKAQNPNELAQAVL